MYYNKKNVDKFMRVMYEYMTESIQSQGVIYLNVYLKHLWLYLWNEKQANLKILELHLLFSINL